MTSGTSGRIAVDMMGGDLGPSEMVAAVSLALKAKPTLNPLILVGDQTVLKPLLDAAGITLGERVSLFHASEVITMEDKPLVGLKQKKDASMVRAIELVKSGDAACVVSCGNTGALMAGGTLKLRTLEGVSRPALAAIVPRKGGHFILVDAGANPEAKAEHLVHNAILASHFCKVMLGIPSPRVGLLTIGTEEGKGNSLVSETNLMLKKIGNIINYSGPIEGFHIFAEHVDVVVCDGFVGNVMLKSWESLVHFFTDVLKEEIKVNPLRMIGAFLSKGAFKAMKNRISPDRYAGAPLLGLNGNIFKAHGSSNRLAIRSAIFAASQIVEADMNHLASADIERANLAMTQA
jgi:glycerol-3-phosphate acyltransferase PlsX